MVWNKGVPLSCCALGLLLTLSGCGGGGTITDSGGTTPPSASLIKVDTVAYSEHCPSKTTVLPGVKVLLHKADGSIQSQWTTDASGHFELEKPSDVAHISLLYKDSKSTYQIQSELSPSYLDLGVRRFVDELYKERCSCKTISVNWTDIHLAQPELSLHLRNPNIELNRNLTGSVTQNYCADNSGLLGKLQLTLAPKDAGPSYIQELDLDAMAANSTHQLKLSEMSQSGNVLTWTANLPLNALYADTYNNGTVQWLFGVSVSSGEALRLFPQANARHRVLAYAEPVMLPESIAGSIGYVSGAQQTVQGSSASLQLPTNQAQLASNFEGILAQWRSSHSTSYDFSGLAGVNQVRLAQTSTKLRWQISTAPNASVVDLLLPAGDAAALADEQISWLALDFSGEGSGLSYSDFQKRQAALSRGTAVDTSAAFDAMRYELIYWSNQ